MIDYKNKFQELMVFYFPSVQRGITFCPFSRAKRISNIRNIQKQLHVRLKSNVEETKNQHCKFKLSNFEFKKFSGEVKDWICFQAQNQEGESIDKDGKIQYFVKATSKGYLVRDFNGSYPPFGDNNLVLAIGNLNHYLLDMSDLLQNMFVNFQALYQNKVLNEET